MKSAQLSVPESPLSAPFHSVPAPPLVHHAPVRPDRHLPQPAPAAPATATAPPAAGPVRRVPVQVPAHRVGVPGAQPAAAAAARYQLPRGEHRAAVRLGLVPAPEQGVLGRPEHVQRQLVQQPAHGGRRRRRGQQEREHSGRRQGVVSGREERRREADPARRQRPGHPGRQRRRRPHDVQLGGRGRRGAAARAAGGVWQAPPERRRGDDGVGPGRVAGPGQVRQPGDDEQLEALVDGASADGVAAGGEAGARQEVVALGSRVHRKAEVYKKEALCFPPIN